MCQLEGVLTKSNRRKWLFVATMVIWFANKLYPAFQNRIIHYCCPHRRSKKSNFHSIQLLWPYSFSCLVRCRLYIFSCSHLIFQLASIIKLVCSSRVYVNFARYLNKGNLPFKFHSNLGRVFAHSLLGNWKPKRHCFNDFQWSQNSFLRKFNKSFFLSNCLFLENYPLTKFNLTKLVF